MTQSLSIAARLAAVKPSPTIAVTTRAAELKASGKDVIGLGAGEPDFDTPDHIKAAAIDAIHKGFTKYTPVGGTNELKDAISAKLKRDNDLTYARNQIVVGVGAKQVIFNAILATVNAGDEVIIPTPYWVSYPDMVYVAEGTPVIVTCSKEDHLKLTPKALEAAITPRTKWLILNSPSNPSGMAYSRGELAALGEVLLRHSHVMVMIDDIYEYLVYDGFEFSTLAQVTPALADRILTVNGVSKSYSMTGWRIGYAAGPAWLIAAMSDIQSHSTSNTCSISQAAAVAALNGDHSFLEAWKDSFVHRRNKVCAALNAINGISCTVPQGAFYLFPDCSALFGRVTPNGARLTNSVDVCAYLLEDALVAAVPGSAFGSEGHFRISYATSEALLDEACVRIARAVGALI
ncbi:MAG: pyridoxal phosphate-dependent aminotransferase [Alphaproteobacteria bacterium]|nr:MAG: pyridoxal phosphate-dependent aminotransferase [Alphaproteobacteria bacterium]